MNNDTPHVFGEDTHGYPHSADSDDGEDFPAFRGWTGWGDRVEPVAPDGYPQPSGLGDFPSPAFMANLPDASVAPIR